MIASPVQTLAKFSDQLADNDLSIEIETIDTSLSSKEGHSSNKRGQSRGI